MERSLMSHFARKATLVAAAFTMVGSTVFGGAALAGGYKDFDKNDAKTEITKLVFAGGDGGVGGDASTTCAANVTGALAFAATAPVTEPLVNSNFCPAVGGDANGAPAIEGAPGENG
jgi:hypothetical protein